MDEYYECHRCDNEVSIYDEDCGQCGVALVGYQQPRKLTQEMHKVLEIRELNEGSVYMVTLAHARKGRVIYILPRDHQIARRAYYCLSGGGHEMMETGVFNPEAMFDNIDFVYKQVDIGRGIFMAYVFKTL